MDIAGKARKLEQKITRTVTAAVDEFVGRGETAPLEIVHAVLDQAEHQVQEIGRGRRVFPFNRIRVHVVTGSRGKEVRARVAAVIEGPPSLSERLVDRLRSTGCRVTDLQAEVIYVRQPGQDWEQPAYHVEFDRVDRPAVAPPVVVEAATEPPRLKLAVITGKAEQHGYIFSGGRIDIGRRAEVLDQRQRLIRTNHVAFAEEGPEANRSVSRRHAHIEFSAEQQCYRLWDDRSAHGTSIIRGGRTIKVPAIARGTRLESGDEIVLGQARLRVTFVKA
jgi:hypothetical protein